MENSQDQPLPPGVHSWPNNLSHPGQTLDSNYSGYYQFSPNVYTHAAPSHQYQFSPNAPPHTYGNNNSFQQGTLSHPGLVTCQALTSEVPPAVKLTEQQDENKSSNHVDGGHWHSETTTSAACQESAVNFRPKVDEAAVYVSNASTICSAVQLNNVCDIDTAAQDAVLREQVGISCV
ncbi:hypothetical protein SESBI_04615 [Sesbania bispinosa]|nr:hypothetical protein SESBI_04615 [Sesbania bispinosa]